VRKALTRVDFLLAQPDEVIRRATALDVRLAGGYGRAAAARQVIAGAGR
jgi:hypothetical protein